MSKKHLTGQEALERIVEAQKRFYQKHGALPTTLRVSHVLALYLLKLGSAHFGQEYGTALWRNGVSEFSRRGIHGLTVTILPRLGCYVECR